MTFLKFGECKLINGEPERLMEVCNKFGGIPAYDRWYQNIAQRKKKVEDKKYNPMRPEQDTNSSLLRQGVFTANLEDQQQYNDMHDFREDIILENFE